MAQSFVSGLRPRGRAQSARVPESDGATVRAGCRTLGIRSQRCLYACWRGGSMGPIFDHREAAAGVCGLQRTVCESAGERWHNGAGGLPDLKISAPSVVARILVWARDATDFRPSINGGATVPVAARRRRACRRATLHRRRRFADFRDSVNSHCNLHPLHALTNATLISAR